VNLLTCPKCQHQMRIISLIDNPLTIEKILKHLNLWQPQAHSPPINDEKVIIEETTYDYKFFDYLPS
jgi:hypothetical protein